MSTRPWVQSLMVFLCLFLGFGCLVATVSLHLYFEFHDRDNHLALFTLLGLSVLLIWLGGFMANSPLAVSFRHEVEEAASGSLGGVLGQVVARIVPGGRRSSDKMIAVPTQVTEETPVVIVPPRPELTKDDEGVL